MKASKQYLKLSKGPTLKRIDKIIEVVKASFPDEALAEVN
jgi:hypothetical protein